LREQNTNEIYNETLVYIILHSTATECKIVAADPMKAGIAKAPGKKKIIITKMK
jgi:hypothetical protein